jgi:hypothetical protein
MKTSILSIISSTIMAVTLVGLSVQAQSARLLVANVPFNFYVKGKALPAGAYRIEATQVGGSVALKIQSADGQITAIVPARLATAKAIHPESRLVFNRFGDQYFLSQVLGFEENATYALLKSRAEEALAKSGSAPGRETVSITCRYR